MPYPQRSGKLTDHAGSVLIADCRTELLSHRLTIPASNRINRRMVYVC